MGAVALQMLVVLVCGAELGLAEPTRCRFTPVPWKHTEHLHFTLVLGVGVLLTQLSMADRGKADHWAFNIFQEIRQKILRKDRNSKCANFNLLKKWEKEAFPACEMLPANYMLKSVI